MYNTIEVRILDIKKVQIGFFKKAGFQSVFNENVKHIKVLPYLSVVQSTEGSYDIALGDGVMQQTQDGGFFIAPSEVQQTIVHHVNRESGGMSARWIFLDVAINGTYSLDALYQFPTVINDERKTELNEIFDRLFATDDIWENYSDCYRLLGYLMKFSSPIKKEPHKGIQNAVTYITEHYAEPISVCRLAAISNMSPSNFYATFQKTLGNSPISYLNHYRLSLAADQLTETNQTISEISYSVGINDALYFSKLFKKTYGVTPKEYRRIFRNDEE